MKNSKPFVGCFFVVVVFFFSSVDGLRPVLLLLGLGFCCCTNPSNSSLPIFPWSFVFGFRRWVVMSSSVADPSSQQQQQASKVCLHNLLLTLFVYRVKSSKLSSSSFEILLVQSCSLSLCRWSFRDDEPTNPPAACVTDGGDEFCLQVHQLEVALAEITSLPPKRVSALSPKP